MGNDNQDYFKRAGRSGGPAGPLGQHRQKLSQQRAFIGRGEERVLPHERRPGWRAPPPREAEAPEAEEREQQAGNGSTAGSAADEARTQTRGNGSAVSAREREPQAGSDSAAASTTEEPSTGTSAHRDPNIRSSGGFGPPASEDSMIGRGPGAQRFKGEEKKGKRLPSPMEGAKWAAKRAGTLALRGLTHGAAFVERLARRRAEGRR